MSRVLVGSLSDFAEGQMVKREVDGQSLLIVKVGGALCAVSNTCPHRGGDLSTGEFADGKVTCPRHGAIFDVRTGKNVEGAKILVKRIATGDLQRYSVELDGDSVFINFS
jgi:3-phenylpropionate/trans-cinnamate dioxygenase ferredoxin component